MTEGFAGTDSLRVDPPPLRACGPMRGVRYAAAHVRMVGICAYVPSLLFSFFDRKLRKTTPEGLSA